MSDIPAAATSVLSEARQVYVALESSQGPHVTPELYAWSDGRLWFPAARSTLKARVVDDGTRLATAVIGRGTAVIMEGTAELFDPRRLRKFLRVESAPRMGRALLSFGLRNTSDLLGFARDTVTANSVPRLPQARVFIAVTPERMAFVESDRVAWHAGWQDVATDPSPKVPTGGSPAVIAFAGPTVAPARWFEDEQRAFVAPELLALHAARGATPVAVVVDEYSAPGPGAKHGVLVRGDGVVDAEGWVQVKAKRTVAWDGTEMTRASGAAPPRAAS